MKKFFVIIAVLLICVGLGFIINNRINSSNEESVDEDITISDCDTLSYGEWVYDMDMSELTEVKHSDDGNTDAEQMANMDKMYLTLLLDSISKSNPDHKYTLYFYEQCIMSRSSLPKIQ